MGINIYQQVSGVRFQKPNAARCVGVVYQTFFSRRSTNDTVIGAAMRE